MSLKKKIFCRILKSAYRSNETFFCRTHSLGCRLEVWLGDCYRKVQGLDLIPLRVPVLIWLPDDPLGARRCAVGQGLDLIPLRVPVLIWLPDGPLGARRCAVGPAMTDA